MDLKRKPGGRQNQNGKDRKAIKAVVVSELMCIGHLVQKNTL